jgi:hypothetical protein
MKQEVGKGKWGDGRVRTNTMEKVGGEEGGGRGCIETRGYLNFGIMMTNKKAEKSNVERATGE